MYKKYQHDINVSETKQALAREKTARQGQQGKRGLSEHLAALAQVQTTN